jgi:DNA mismatch repair protein MutS
LSLLSFASPITLQYTECDDYSDVQKSVRAYPQDYMSNPSFHTPLMQQYHEIKNEYRDSLLLFQVGDFYELFYEDAKKAAAFLGIALTARGKDRGQPIPLCGVPVHTKDYYIARLIKGGFNVAICDQLEPATPGVVVQRGVTQVLTPGTLVDSALLDDKKASYLFSCFPTAHSCGLLFGELLTTQLFATTLPQEAYKTLEAEVHRFLPDEIIVPATVHGKQYATKLKQWGYHVTMVEAIADHSSHTQIIEAWATRQFCNDIVQTLMQFNPLTWALHYFYTYVQRSQRAAMDQFHTLTFYKPDEFLMLDAATQKNLELVKNNQDNSTRNTLFYVLDRAQTPMGSRLLRKWIVRPLVKKELIIQRQEVVALFVHHYAHHEQIRQFLVSIGDLERIVGRIAFDRAPLHDYLSLKRALHTMPSCMSILESFHTQQLIQTLLNMGSSFETLVTLLDCALNDNEAEEWFIKRGFDADIDHMRDTITHSAEKLTALERLEQERTGIPSLKVRYNQVHGYYIEITKTHLALIPPHYIRKQTLVGKERFITTELQKLAYEIEHAHIDLKEREKLVFTSIKRKVFEYIGLLRKLAHHIGNLDALVSLALVAREQNYVRPLLNETYDIVITEGRHPVVETTLHAPFITNDTVLNNQQSLLIITGPNMGGKSTYLRQTALISIMAQLGSFIPAKAASLPLLDRIFTRIGAGDSVADGKSTFLIEMEETATICTQATERSLVILDEVGRGTSTFDGLAIAQAVVEHICTRLGSRCLFATHYHELTKLEEEYSTIASYYAASSKTAHGIVFLYKIIRGTADGSFGLEVAKLANLPETIVTRAQQVLDTLKTKNNLLQP